MKNKATPGPWEISGNLSVRSKINGARVLELAAGGVEADRVLAAAAPEMLAALGNILSMAETSGDAAIAAEAREAIAKALGGN